MVMRIALWGPLLLAVLLVGGYIYMHSPFARDGTELLQVPFSENDTAKDRFGDMHYRGGLDIPRMGHNIGGLSGLRWHGESGRLLAITDDGRWIWITPEESDGVLVGISKIESGPLLGADGATLTGKTQGDSESLTRAKDGGWLIGFERNHRLLHYPEIDAKPVPASVDPALLLSPYGENSGLETLAGDEKTLFACAERMPEDNRPNCIWDRDGGVPEPFTLSASPAIAWNGAVPTDADQGSDEKVYVLFRSYSPKNGNWVGVSEFHRAGDRRDLLVLDPINTTVDNFEGLAVREEEGRTFLYIVSDDNFSGSQRTLLMKFELFQD